MQLHHTFLITSLFFYNNYVRVNVCLWMYDIFVKFQKDFLDSQSKKSSLNHLKNMLLHLKMIFSWYILHALAYSYVLQEQDFKNFNYSLALNNTKIKRDNYQRQVRFMCVISLRTRKFFTPFQKEVYDTLSHNRNNINIIFIVL